MNRRRGLTLIETVVTTALLVAVTGMAFQILVGTSSAAVRGTLTGDLESRGKAVAEHFRAQILTAKLVGTGPSLGGTNALGITTGRDGTEIRYQIPVAREASGNVLYGFTHAVGEDDAEGEDWMCVLRFEADGVLKESASSADGAQPAPGWGGDFPAPASLGSDAVEVLDLDLNGDGDTADTFVRGRLRRYVVTPDGDFASVESLSDQVLLRVESGSFYSSPTGTDRLFSYLPSGAASAGAANEAVITVWHGTLDDDRKSLLSRECAGSVRFRNHQTE